eukprot:2518451-Amphidinium_carterae.2
MAPIEPIHLNHVHDPGYIGDVTATILQGDPKILGTPAALPPMAQQRRLPKISRQQPSLGVLEVIHLSPMLDVANREL